MGAYPVNKNEGEKIMNGLQKISDDMKKVGVIGAAEHILAKLGVIERSTYIIRLAGYYDKLCEKDMRSELSKWYKDVKGKELDLENPQTFDEKIQWMKIYDSTPLKTQLADKYLVRKYIENTFGGGGIKTCWFHCLACGTALMK